MRSDFVRALYGSNVTGYSRPLATAEDGNGKSSSASERGAYRAGPLDYRFLVLPDQDGYNL